MTVEPTHGRLAEVQAAQLGVSRRSNHTFLPGKPNQNAYIQRVNRTFRE